MGQSIVIEGLGCARFGNKSKEEGSQRIFVHSGWEVMAITELPMISQHGVKNAPTEPTCLGLPCQFRAKTASF